jgi:cellulose synthase/poly-beta-1,6-N-acetylglucosamine synthase-like glycosyltransferase
MIAIEVLAVILAATVLIPVAVVFAQVMLALAPARGSVPSGLTHPRVAVLIPAHNEAEGIVATLRSILPQLEMHDRLLVVADNCTDSTARIAADAGAVVIERTDVARRGKGYALDFGIRYLASVPPEVVIVVDADCLVANGGIDRLARVCGESQRPVQALYQMYAPLHATLQMRISEFAWMMKNWIRPLGNERLSLPCQLMGTGMALPWALISNASLAHAELVEDMKLGIDLAIAGHPPMFCPEVHVTSQFPETAEAVSVQRTRWEHGHMGMILREAPRLLMRSLTSRDMRLLGLALDLAVPPLALLVLLTMVVFILALTLSWMGLSAFPFILVFIALGLLVMSVLIAWLGWGRRILSIGAFFLIPIYVLSKIPLYFKFWARRQKEWVRTERK